MATNVERMERSDNSDVGRTLKGIGEQFIRYGLVVILLWVGALKFTAYEAEGIQGLVANSPLMSWGYSVMSVRGFAMLPIAESCGAKGRVAISSPSTISTMPSNIANPRTLITL